MREALYGDDDCDFALAFFARRKIGCHEAWNRVAFFACPYCSVEVPLSLFDERSSVRVADLKGRYSLLWHEYSWSVCLCCEDENNYQGAVPCASSGVVGRVFSRLLLVCFEWRFLHDGQCPFGRRCSTVWGERRASWALCDALGLPGRSLLSLYVAWWFPP